MNNEEIIRQLKEEIERLKKELQKERDDKYRIYLELKELRS